MTALNSLFLPSTRAWEWVLVRARGYAAEATITAFHYPEDENCLDCVLESCRRANRSLTMTLVG